MNSNNVIEQLLADTWSSRSRKTAPEAPVAVTSLLKYKYLNVKYWTFIHIWKMIIYYFLDAE